jgi:hypothetical protein
VTTTCISDTDILITCIDLIYTHPLTYIHTPVFCFVFFFLLKSLIIGAYKGTGFIFLKYAQFCIDEKLKKKLKAFHHFNF